MVQNREAFVVTRAARAVLGVTVALGLCAAVAASPVRFAPVINAAPKPVPVAFKPLGEGPAIAVQKSFGRHDEDCVTVTQVKSADGRTFTTRGMVCAE